MASNDMRDGCLLGIKCRTEHAVSATVNIQVGNEFSGSLSVGKEAARPSRADQMFLAKLGIVGELLEAKRAPVWIVPVKSVIRRFPPYRKCLSLQTSILNSHILRSCNTV
jgi:hypothetical protein